MARGDRAPKAGVRLPPFPGQGRGDRNWASGLTGARIRIGSGQQVLQWWRTLEPKKTRSLL